MAKAMFWDIVWAVAFAVTIGSLILGAFGVTLPVDPLILFIIGLAIVVLATGESNQQ